MANFFKVKELKKMVPNKMFQILGNWPYSVYGRPLVTINVLDVGH